MTDLTTLRALAERARDADATLWDIHPAALGTITHRRVDDAAHAARSELSRAASPATILALFDRVERAEAALRLIVDMPEAPAIVSGGYADGYNGARDDAAEIARAALTPETPQ